MADIMYMDQASLFDLIKRVFESPQVIGVTVILILYLNFVFYVACYRKKKRPVERRRRRRTSAAPKPAEPEKSPAENRDAGFFDSGGSDDAIV